MLTLMMLVMMKMMMMMERCCFEGHLCAAPSRRRTLIAPGSSRLRPRNAFCRRCDLAHLLSQSSPKRSISVRSSCKFRGGLTWYNVGKVYILIFLPNLCCRPTISALLELAEPRIKKELKLKKNCLMNHQPDRSHVHPLFGGDGLSAVQ